MFFYVFTGSDVTSSFYQLSKVTWWNLWCNNLFITPVFRKLIWTPIAITESDFTHIERFDTQKLFNVTAINELRFQLFSATSDNNLHKLPPSK